MAKVLVDIGAHLGETLAVAQQERWGFDRIWSFEPAPACWPALEAMADEHVEVLHFGLWTCDAHLPLHDPGEVGASLVAAKARTEEVAEVEVRDAAAWFAEHLDPGDEILVKVNCEGAECDLLEHLAAAGQLAGVDQLLVHFDVRKVPALAHREAEARAVLDAAGVPYHAADALLVGTDTASKVEHWLRWYHAGPLGRVWWGRIRPVGHRARVAAWRLRYRVRHRAGR